MFKDKKEELRRLEEALLQEAQLEAEEARLEEELEEAQALLDDPCDFGEEQEQTYYNFANRYGTRHAYNSDTTDEDLDTYSREVYSGADRKSVRFLAVLAVCLLLAILAVLAWIGARYLGLLG